MFPKFPMHLSALRPLLLSAVLLACTSFVAHSQSPAPPPPPQPDAAAAPPSDPVLARVLREWPNGMISNRNPGAWTYELGTLLDGVTAQWRATGDGRLFEYVHAAVDHSVDKDGVIHFPNGKPFPSAAHSLDDVEMGRSVLVLYRVLQQPRYYTAAKFLHDQIATQPKNSFGGYWHKGIYPNQMWLDGAYMAEPFSANYARTFNQPREMDGIAEQFLLMSAHMRDPHSGLLRHGWDASKKMDWADKTTGQSPEVWARAMGWYAMALVDVLDRMPPADPQRAVMEDLTRRTLTSIARFQDRDTGLWYEVLDKGNLPARNGAPAQTAAKGNYLEASASCMFVYALAHAIREGVLPFSYEANVSKGWAGIQSHFVQPDGTLTGTVSVGGLGGNPYRSGSYDYYLSEKVVDNDAKGVGAYLLALSEITLREQAGDLLRKARGKTVLFDGWFHSQTRKNADGSTEPFHYKPSDDANSGYSWFNRMFQTYGMRSDTLDHAPTAADLKSAEIYVIVSPDIPALNPSPHYMDKASAEAIEAWVRAGGVLVLMENDSEHADQTHLDLLSDRFGLHFNPVTVNKELGNDYTNTLIQIPAGTGGIFKQAHTAVMKETATLTISGPAKSLLTHTNAESPEPFTVMAVSHLGKGLVYANVDPWIYNEYTDGRKLPLHEDNFAAGEELVHWLVTQAVTH